MAFKSFDFGCTWGIKRGYQTYCTRHVSGMIFIRYAKYRKIGKPHYLSCFGAIEPKDKNRLRPHMPEGGEP